MGFKIGFGTPCTSGGLVCSGEGRFAPDPSPQKPPIPFRPLTGARSAGTPWMRLRKIRAPGCLAGHGISVTSRYPLSHATRSIRCGRYRAQGPRGRRNLWGTSVQPASRSHKRRAGLRVAACRGGGNFQVCAEDRQGLSTSGIGAAGDGVASCGIGCHIAAAETESVVGGAPA